MSLSPSQRISLIRNIGAQLSQDSWPHVDMTLREFSLPTYDQYSGSRETYVFEALDGQDDKVIIDLGRHLGLQLDEVLTSAPEPNVWKKNTLRVFVSHLAKHRLYAGSLQDVLLRFGIDSFIAHTDIEPTQEWQTEIEKALSTCDALIALLHPNFHRSKWTDQEIGFAMGRGIPVFSVKLGHDPHGFIGRFQAFNGAGKGELALARELLLAYVKHEQTKNIMSNALVTSFCESESYARAKTLINYLEQLETWDPNFSTQITAANKKNGQISGSYGVTARVKALVKKWT